MSSRILIVEDDAGLRRLLAETLRDRGYQPCVAADAAAAVELLAVDSFHLVVLDLGLPDRDGLAFLRDLRRDNRIPVVILTARRDESERVLGLELGADDYLTKPFSPRELVARIEAILRREGWHRREAQGGTSTLSFGSLEVDEERWSVRRNGQPIPMTRTELRLLVALARRPGRVWTRERLVDVVWDGIFVEERGVDAVVSRLRRKLGPRPDGASWIRTVHGLGYAFDTETGQDVVGTDNDRRA